MKKKDTVSRTTLLLMTIGFVVIMLISCTDAVPTYTVHFDSLDGSETVSIETMRGSKIYEPKSPKRDNYMFDGWYKDVNFTLIWDFNRDIVSSDITLYAKWDACTYSITYNGNGNDNGIVPPIQEKTYGIDLELATNSGALQRTGHSFVGWNTQADGNGMDYPSGTNYTINSGMTLYAKWTANSYAVTYNANGSTSGSAPANQTKIYGIGLNLSTNNGGLVRAGYTFSGWNTQLDGLGADYAPESLYNADAALTLYAKWITNSYTVTYNANGATSGLVPATQIKSHGIGLHLSENSGELSRRGYTFTSWNTQPDGLGADYMPGTIYNFDAVLTLYAKWTPNSYTVSFDSQGGGAVDSISVIYEQAYGELPIPIKEHQVFKGWYTNEDGMGSKLTSENIYRESSDQILYAKWLFDVYEGPAGGLVFYENPNHETDGWQYLEAAPSGWYKGAEQSGGVYTGTEDPMFQWGVYGLEIGPVVQGTAIGTGQSNTTAIVSFHNNLKDSYPEKGDYYLNPTDYCWYNDGTVAAIVCAEYSFEKDGVTYDDWFMPSKDELNQMRRNLYGQGVGGISDACYWSSSETDAISAWAHFFNSDYQNFYLRTNAYRVRPVRTF